MKPEIDIPEDLQQACRDFAKVAQKYNLSNLSVSFNPPILHEWREQIQFHWDSGRHNEDANEIEIHSTYQVNTRVRP